MSKLFKIRIRVPVDLYNKNIDSASIVAYSYNKKHCHIYQ